MKKLSFLWCETGSCEHKSWTDAALLLLRVVLGVIFIVHGWQKLFGSIGIDGFTGFLTSLSVPAPLFFAWVVSILEFFGGIAVLLGVWTRVVALFLAVDMLVAFWLLPISPPQGDLHGSLFAIALALVLAGGGRFVVWKSKCCKVESSEKENRDMDEMIQGK